MDFELIYNWIGHFENGYLQFFHKLTFESTQLLHIKTCQLPSIQARLDKVGKRMISPFSKWTAIPALTSAPTLTAELSNLSKKLTWQYLSACKEKSKMLIIVLYTKPFSYVSVQEINFINDRFGSTSFLFTIWRLKM